MHTGADVTDLHQAKQEVQNSDEKLRMASGNPFVPVFGTKDCFASSLSLGWNG